MDFQEIEVLGIKFLFGRTIAPKNQLLMIKVGLLHIPNIKILGYLGEWVVQNNIFNLKTPNLYCILLVSCTFHQMLSRSKIGDTCSPCTFYITYIFTKPAFIL